MNWEDIEDSGKLYYTIMVYNLKVEEIIKKVESKLEKVNNNMKNNFKKKIINQRLYPVLEYLKDQNLNEILNILLFSGKDLNIFNLTKKQILICNNWNLPQFYFYSDDKFNIDYLKNLFNEKNTNIIFEINNQNLKIIEIDKVKSRILEQNNITDDEYFDLKFKNFNPKIIHGTGSYLKKIKNINNIYTKKLDTEFIIDKIEELEILNNHKILELEVLSQIENPQVINKLMFGKKEVSNGILDYMVKKLFISKKLYKSLKKNISKEYLNFEIIIIKKNSNGDIGDIFFKNYEGIIGIKYY